MNYIMNLTFAISIALITGYALGWSYAESKNPAPDHELINTNIGYILLKNSKIYAVEEVHQIVVDPTMLQQLTAKIPEKKK